MKVNSKITPFELQGQEAFKAYALELFAFQYQNNPLYQEFCKYLGKTPKNVLTLEALPYLPISFFKTHELVLAGTPKNFYFSSSGTTGSKASKHFVPELDWYQKTYTHAFELFYGTPTQYCILALLPAYLEREGSSLIYMVQDLIAKSKHPKSGFYLHNHKDLKETLEALETQGTKTLLIGVSFALLDFVENYPMPLKHTIVIETGGMKGRRKEMIREALHLALSQGFGLSKIHSEYGMTELLSQAYSKGDGIFECPPWMRISIRDTQDPLSLIGDYKTGGINIIDLANTHSCAFIATQDLGKTWGNGKFSVLGRFDHAAIRGCNLLVP